MQKLGKFIMIIYNYCPLISGIGVQLYTEYGGKYY